ncbi:MAG: DNA-processing protein DprA [Bacteroidales bacterium]
MIPKIGSINAKKLIAYCGGVDAVFRESKKNLLKIPGIGDKIATEVVNQSVLANAEAEIKFIEKYGIKVLYFTEPEYPERLKQCEDGPVTLYVKSKGDFNFNVDKIISIVGTRKATSYGKGICDEIVNGLKQKGYNPIIVSGLAYGIDIAAHKAALKHQLPTVAVLGHGLDTIYPSVHTNIAKEIVNSGALVTDFASKTVFDRNNFLRRNRIIAGLADATVVIESAEEGGALVTADIANSYNREVFAVPGNVTSTYSKGCNQLIKQNKAALIESADDIEFFLGWKSNAKNKIVQTSIDFDSLNPDEQKILAYLKEHGEETIDVISIKIGVAVPAVLSALLNLEFSGAIISKPGKIFALKSM